MVKSSVLMSWFIVIIMVGSILGFAFYYVGNDNPDSGTDTGTDQNAPPLADTTQLQFSAAGIDANVIDSLPSILIVAETDEAEINKIDSEIYLADQNIRQVLSSYMQPQANSQKALIYRAEISLAPRSDPIKIINEISSDSNHLSSIQAVKSILVRLPKNISFSNKDLNLEKEYEFRDSTVQVFASPQTIMGDNLKVTLNATFQGQELTQITGFEEENLSEKLLQKTISLNAPISELEPVLLVSAEQVSFSNIAPISALAETFKKLQDVNDSSFSIPIVQPKITLSVSGIDQNQVFDLNALAASLPDLNFAETQITSEGFFASLTFKSDLNTLGPQRNSIAEKLRGMNVSSDRIEMQESRTSLFGTVSLKSPSAAKEIYNKIGTSIFSKGVLAKIYQPAKLRVFQIFDPDTNALVEVPGQSIGAEVTPTHALDENVSVQVRVALQRGKLLYAQAVELQ